MKAKFGAIVVDGRGKINGFVASKNRAGNYFRTKTTPVNPQSGDQMAVRADLAALSQGWRNLTQAQRDAWNAAVNDFQTTNIFGDLKTPSGFNLFVRLNRNLQVIGVATLADPPAVSSPETLTALAATVAVTGSQMDIDFAPDPVPANNRLVIEATPPMAPGRSFVKNLYRVIQIVNAAGAAPADVWAAYVAKFGAPAAGQQIFFRGKLTKSDAGIVSAPLTTSAIVAA